MVRPGTSRGNRGTKRSFYLFEAGKYEGEKGYWAEDEDTNEEGFLSTENETFWTLDEANDEWHQANVAGRKIKKRDGCYPWCITDLADSLLSTNAGATSWCITGS